MIVIDFSSEVEIAVIAGDRSANIYSVNAIVNETLPFISEFSFGPVGLSVYSCANTKLLITGIIVYVDGEELCHHMALLLLGSSGLLCFFVLKHKYTKFGVRRMNRNVYR